MNLRERLLARNVGNLDRLLRTVPAVLTCFAWAIGWLGGWPFAILALVSAGLFLSALTGRCTVYALLGRSTCPAAAITKNGGYR